MRRILTILILLFSLRSGGQAVILVTSVNAVYSTAAVATASVTTTASSLIVVGITGRAAQGMHLQDSKNNTWTPCTVYGGSGAQAEVEFFYCINPTVGSNHAFQNTDGGGTSNFGGISVFCYSVTAGYNWAKDQENGQFIATLGTTAQPGPITPTGSLSVELTIDMNINGTAPVMPSGYAGFVWPTATAFMGGCGYQISSSTTNPSWAGQNSGSNGAVAVVNFKATSASSTTQPGFFLFMLGTGMVLPDTPVIKQICSADAKFLLLLLGAGIINKSTDGNKKTG